MIHFIGSLLMVIVVVSLSECEKVPSPRSPHLKKKDPLKNYVCQPSENGYLVPDPDQCDRFAICSPDGKKSIELCRDGYALDHVRGICDLIHKVDCRGRELLQDSTVQDERSPCLRANGFYPLPAPSPKDGGKVDKVLRKEMELACQKFYDCRNGRFYLHDCPAGTVFNTATSECLHPDQATREECKASTLFNFVCPDYKLRASGKHEPRLVFGDHDRVAHPDDCSKFYSCLVNGEPRLSSCKNPLVFNPQTGFCTHYSQVESCKDYYSELSQNITPIVVVSELSS